MPAHLTRPATPWATGLTLTGLVAALVSISLVWVSLDLASANLWLAVLVNLVIAAGSAPSIWLSRSVLTWRWVGWGVASGILLAWLALLLSSLG